MVAKYLHFFANLDLILFLCPTDHLKASVEGLIVQVRTLQTKLDKVRVWRPNPLKLIGDLIGLMGCKEEFHPCPLDLVIFEE